MNNIFDNIDLHIKYRRIESSLIFGFINHDLKHVGVIRTHCTDNCKRGPVVCLQPDNAWHFHVDEHKAIVLLKKLWEPIKD